MVNSQRLTTKSGLRPLDLLKIYRKSSHLYFHQSRPLECKNPHFGVDIKVPASPDLRRQPFEEEQSIKMRNVLSLGAAINDEVNFLRENLGAEVQNMT